jgi:hypothetical protein
LFPHSLIKHLFSIYIFLQVLGMLCASPFLLPQWDSEIYFLSFDHTAWETALRGPACTGTGNGNEQKPAPSQNAPPAHSLSFAGIRSNSQEIKACPLKTKHRSVFSKNPDGS